MVDWSSDHPPDPITNETALIRARGKLLESITGEAVGSMTVAPVVEPVRPLLPSSFTSSKQSGEGGSWAVRGWLLDESCAACERLGSDQGAVRELVPSPSSSCPIGYRTAREPPSPYCFDDVNDDGSNGRTGSAIGATVAEPMSHPHRSVLMT